MSAFNKSRRKFISDTAKGSIAAGIGLTAAGSLLSTVAVAGNSQVPFFATGYDQQPLPYKYDALENIIDAMTMEIHYSKHAAAYSKNVKEAAAAILITLLLVNVSAYILRMPFCTSTVPLLVIST